MLGCQIRWSSPFWVADPLRAVPLFLSVLYLLSHFQFLGGGGGMHNLRSLIPTLCRRYFTGEEAEALKDGIFVFQTYRLFSIELLAIKHRFTF